MNRGTWLMVAAALFWVSWLLMPGVGVTDARDIFALVSAQRSLVLASVVVQLVSAALYVPALLGLANERAGRHARAMRWGAGLLLVGAMGSAADAVLHLLAYAMTAPQLDLDTLVTVMTFMQFEGLFILAPLLLSFFIGGAVLSIAASRLRLSSPWNPRLHAIAVLVALAGGGLAFAGLVSARLVGLATLGLVSAAQAWTGASIAARERHV